MTKDEIIRYVATIVNFCVADGNTYLYAKCSPTIEQDSKKVLIGGGNFTVLLSTLATIEFLATIDVIIKSKKEDFYTDGEINKINKKKKELLGDALLERCFLVPKKGALKNNSGKNLRELIENTSCLTGISKKEAGKIQAIRNKLVHEFTPKIVSAAGIKNVPGADFVNLILNYKNTDVYCLASNHTIGLNSNALNHKLPVLLKYTIEKINDLDVNSEVLKKLADYIENTK